MWGDYGFCVSLHVRVVEEVRLNLIFKLNFTNLDLFLSLFQKCYQFELHLLKTAHDTPETQRSKAARVQSLLPQTLRLIVFFLFRTKTVILGGILNCFY